MDVFRPSILRLKTILYDKPIEMMFMGVDQGKGLPVYPCWLYKDDTDPILVHDTDEEDRYRALGYDSITSAAMSNRFLINWFWDLEDMSANQLHVFALEEYGIDLPVDAGQEKLFTLICKLTVAAPQNKNRLIFMAHTIQMNYDATLEEIRRMMTPGALGVASEIESREVVI